MYFFYQYNKTNFTFASYNRCTDPKAVDLRSRGSVHTVMEVGAPIKQAEGIVGLCLV